MPIGKLSSSLHKSSEPLHMLTDGQVSNQSETLFEVPCRLRLDCAFRNKATESFAQRLSLVVRPNAPT